MDYRLDRMIIENMSRWMDKRVRRERDRKWYDNSK